MSKTIIYYFSGTGNSLYAAMCVGKRLGDTLLVHMKADPADYPAMDAEVIGFVFPVYVDGLPGGCETFIEKVKINPDAYIFALATCGISTGNSYYVLHSLLQKKGAALRCYQTAVTVANFINMYPLFLNSQKRLMNLDDAAAAVCATVESGLSMPVPKNRPLRQTTHFASRAFPAAARLYRATDKCNGCGLCAKVCPSGTVKIVNGHPVWGNGCRQCVACIQLCPQKAVECGFWTVRRTRYRHPRISAADIAKETIFIP